MTMVSDKHRRQFTDVYIVVRLLVNYFPIFGMQEYTWLSPTFTYTWYTGEYVMTMCLIASEYVQYQTSRKNYPWMQDCGFVLIQKQG